ncbi:hypothetical protein B7463_g7626, partial [Scytalidium lignicola]
MPTTVDYDTGIQVVPLLIDGKATASNPPIRFQVVSSSQKKVVYLAEAADAKAVVTAAQAAETAFKRWSRTSAISRRDILLRVADLLKARQDELMALQMEETSCTKGWAYFQISYAVVNIQETAARITEACAGTIPAPAGEETTGFVFMEPIGPVFLMSPWNAAVILSVRNLGSILGAGCTSVWKASELSPRTHHALAEIFMEAGLPPGVLNVIQSRREDAAAITEALISHPAIRKVDFIGSDAVAIVLDDANLEDAASKCAEGAFLHHGQICFSTERIIVQKKIAGTFLSLLQKHAAVASSGDGVTERVITNAYNKLVEAKSKGAKFIIGGPQYDSSSSLRPTIVTGVTKDMSMWDEETFGPSVAVFIVETEQEAIDLANNTRFGLNAAVHTANMHRGLIVARQLEYGQVHVNSLTEADEPRRDEKKRYSTEAKAICASYKSI